MKKLILNLVITAIIFIGITQSSYSQKIAPDKKFRVVTNYTNSLNPMGFDVTCTFKMYTSNGYLFATEEVTVPANNSMDFKSSIVWSPGYYFSYSILGIKSSSVPYTWFTYFVHDDYVMDFEDTVNNLQWYYGIPPTETD